MTLRLVAAVALLAALSTVGTAGARVPGPSAGAQLTLMPLPLAAYGSGAAGLKLDSDSGVVDNATAAENSTTKADSAKSLTRAGRVTGYQLAYNDYARVAKPESLVYVSSELDLYRSGAAASKGLAAQLADAAASDPASGVHVLSSERFAVHGLGDEAVGIHVKAKVGTAVLWFTGVAVRRDDLLESITVLRTDGGSQQATALGLAHALSDRVSGVIAGRITTPPAGNVPAAKAKAPVVSTVKLDPGALTAGDLNGAKITRSEYVKDADAVAAYEREFDSTRYGNTRLLSAESDVSLYSSPAAAQVFIEGMGSLFSPANPSFRSFISQAFSQGAGFKITSFAVRRHRDVALGGAKGHELVLRIRTPLGTIDVAYAFISNGSLTSAVIATSSFGSSIDLGDLERLEGAAAGRLRELKAQLPASA
jgi:hypothetical protein